MKLNNISFFIFPILFFLTFIIASVVYNTFIESEEDEIVAIKVDTDAVVNAEKSTLEVEDSETDLEIAEEQPPQNVEVVSNRITVTMVGDMMFEHPLYEMIRDQSASPYDWVKEIFFVSDIVVGNLETTINGIEKGIPADKYYHFSAPIEVVNKLVESQFDAVNIANNHIKDYGNGGLLETIAQLDQVTIKPFGAGESYEAAYEPVILEEKNTKIAFLGFYGDAYSETSVSQSSPGVAFFDRDRVYAAIQNAKQQADVVIVWAHWGDEHVGINNAFQSEWGHWMIDSGADMIVGAHPHVRQNYEQYNGKWIFYSLGNFVTTGMGWDPEAIIGYMLHVTIENKTITDASVTNVELSYHGYPDPEAGDGIGLN